MAAGSDSTPVLEKKSVTLPVPIHIKLIWAKLKSTFSESTNTLYSQNPHVTHLLL